MTRTLLLADANPAIQRLVSLTFAGQDMNVVAVSDGEQAIARISSDPPDIVLADVAAPTRSGYDIAAYVKGREDRAHIPVLLVASALEPVDQARARDVRCNGVLLKPFEPGQVVRRVQELVAGASGSPSQTLAGVPRPVDRLVAPKPDEAVWLKPDAPTRRDEPAKVVKHPSAQPPDAPKDDPLGDYFDSLDAAFDTIKPATAAADLHHQAPDLDDEERADLPTLSAVLGETSPPPVFKDEILFAAPGDAGQPRAMASDLVAPMRSVAAGAFEALEAEERLTRATTPPPAAVPPISPELVDAVAARIIERLGAHGAAQLVSRLVAEVTERLVREEIDRIRGRK